MKPKLRIESPPVAPKAEPLSAPEFAHVMEKFAPFAAPLRVAAGVSGGPDSMALAFCVQRWIERQKTGVLIALIVDHDLRKESAAEAGQTRKVLSTIGIESEVLRWEHLPVTARLHETARKARLQLLNGYCREHGIAALMLGHQQEDQAETILMRFAKGSGIDGLAGMRAESARDGVRILRPFLNISKERLEATCAGARLPFVSDFSNESMKFARGRLRRVLPLLEAEGLTIERLNDLGARAAEARAALDHAASMLLRVAGKRDDAGAIRLDLEHLRAAPRAVAERALAACLQSIRPEDYAPAHASLASLCTALLADATMPARTLHGCLFGKNESHASIMREPSAIGDSAAIAPGASVLWDRRWHVMLNTGAPEKLVIGPLGTPPYELLDRLAPGLRKQIPQGRARAAIPALWLNGALALIPALPQSSYSAAASAALVAGWPPIFGH